MKKEPLEYKAIRNLGAASWIVMKRRGLSSVDPYTNARELAPSVYGKQKKS